MKISEHIYFCPNGRNRLKVIRKDLSDGSKIFTQYHWSKDSWQLGKGEGPIAPLNYHLFKNSTERIILVEGEKCAEILIEGGVAATTHPGGANSWSKEYAPFFKGLHVVILPDNDDPGRKLALQQFKDIKDYASKVEIVELPGLTEKEDVFDWIKNGGTIEELFALPVSGVTSSKIFSSGFNLQTGDDFLKKEIPEREWLLEGMILADGFTLLCAKPKVGKSTFARNLVASVTTGSIFLDRKVKLSKVLYIALEENEREFQRQFKSLNVDSARLTVHIGKAPLNSLAELKSLLEIETFDLIIIDPLFKFISVKDVNDYNSVNLAFTELLEISRKCRNQILCIHHMNKSSFGGNDAILGSTAMFGGVDTTILMEMNERKVRTFSTTQRYGEGIESTELEYDIEKGIFKIGAPAELRRSEIIKNKIIDYLNLKKRPIKRNELVKALHLKRENVLKTINDLITAQVLEEASDGLVMNLSSQVPPLYIREFGNQEEGEA